MITTEQLSALAEAALVLENDGTFYKAWLDRAGSNAREMREYLASSGKSTLRKCGASASALTALGNRSYREAMRVYLDAKWMEPGFSRKPGPDPMEVIRSDGTSVIPWPDEWGTPPPHVIPAQAAPPIGSVPRALHQPTTAHEETTVAVTIPQALVAPKEITMNTIKIETRTFVNGTDLKGMPKSAIYDMIAQQEAAIEKLEAIKNKPTMLKKEIAERQAGIDALVAHLDSVEQADAPKVEGSL